MATKKVKYTSPRGVFRFPALTKPDFGTDAFPKPDGEFKTQLILSPAAAEALEAKLAPLYKQAEEEAATKFAALKPEARKKLGGSVKMNELKSEVYEKDSEEPTGDFYFKFATKASGKNQKGEPWSKTLDLFDAAGKKIKGKPQIWSGSEGRVSFTAAPYFVPGTGVGGLKLYLEGAQVIQLVSGSGGDASSYGFGKEEGYEEEETAAASAGFSDDADASTDEEPDDF